MLVHPHDEITKPALYLLKVMLEKIKDESDLLELMESLLGNDQEMEVFVETTKCRLEQAMFAHIVR